MNEIFWPILISDYMGWCKLLVNQQMPIIGRYIAVSIKLRTNVHLIQTSVFLSFHVCCSSAGILARQLSEV